MHLYPSRVLERAMKIKEVITRAMSGSINWIQAAEILGMSDLSFAKTSYARIGLILSSDDDTVIGSC